MRFARQWALLLLAAALAIVPTSGAWALGGEGMLRDLRLTAWTAREGAPPLILAMAQTADGYLWLGSPTGLDRFDATRFEHIDLPGQPGLSSAAIYSLYAPPTGGLWIGYTLGGAVFLKDGNATAYGSAEGMPSASVKAFARTRDGTVWIATTRGLGRLHGGRWELASADWGLPAVPVPFQVLMTDSTGALWAGCGEKLFRLAPGQRHFEEILSDLPDQDAVAESPDGTIWVSDFKTVRKVYRNPRSNRSWMSVPCALFIDADESIWALESDTTASVALVRLRHDERRSGETAIRLASGVDKLTWNKQALLTASSTMLVDREGDVWVSALGGPSRLAERSLRPVRIADSGFVPLYGGITPGDGGTLWAYQYGSSGTFSVGHGQRSESREMGTVTAGTRTRSGQVWLAGDAALWLWRGRAFERIDRPAAGTTRVQAIAEEGDGALWVSIIRQGLFRRQAGRWVRQGGIATLGDGAAVVLAEDASGAVWAGYPDDRVAEIRGTEARFLAGADGLQVGHVTAIYGSRRFVWVGGDAGLARIDGDHVQMLATDDASAARDITGIVETADGDLWLQAASGIVHVTAAEIQRAVADRTHVLATEVFDARAGLEGSGARINPLPTLVEATDGILWMVTSAGVYSLDPAHVSRNPMPPTIVVEHFLANDKPMPIHGDVALPAGTDTLRILYNGLSLSAAEKVRYRYRLDGVDKDWRDVQDHREATYTYLPPGGYRFRVQARLVGTPWNATESTLRFDIAPTFVQTRGFIALCVAVGLLLVWAIIRLRVAHVSRRLRLEILARTDERERIARELHDTLLQGAQGLILSVHATAARLPHGDPLRETLEEAVEQGDALLLEGRDRIQDLRLRLRLRDDPVTNLARALGAIGDNWREQGATATFAVDVEGTARLLRAVARDEAYRIAREAIFNAFQHSQAAAIAVKLGYTRSTFHLRILDDGCGIDPVVLNDGGLPGHWGLAGMGERARSIGGDLDIRSSPGAGTAIGLRLPAAIAYEPGVPKRRWWQRAARR